MRPFVLPILAACSLLVACAEKPTGQVAEGALLPPTAAAAADPAPVAASNVASTAEQVPTPSAIQRAKAPTTKVAAAQPAAPSTIRGLPGGNAGAIVSYRFATVSLYPSDTSGAGVEVPSKDLGAPLSVVAVSDTNKRLKVHTTVGDKWIDPNAVEYSEILSDGQPAFRDKKFVAGGRGID